MALLYGWGSTASRLPSHYEEAVYFLPLNVTKATSIKPGVIYKFHSSVNCTRCSFG